MKEIARIDKKSLAKIMALIYGLVSFVSTLAAAVFSEVSTLLQKDFQGSIVLVTLYNVGAGLVFGALLALLAAALGYIIGYIKAVIYNWFSLKVGGVRVKIEDTTSTDAADTMINENLKIKF